MTISGDTPDDAAPRDQLQRALASKLDEMTGGLLAPVVTDCLSQELAGVALSWLTDQRTPLTLVVELEG